MDAESSSFQPSGRGVLIEQQDFGEIVAQSVRGEAS